MMPGRAERTEIVTKGTKVRVVLYDLGEGVTRTVLHSPPKGDADPNEVSWLEHDTSGYTDGGPSCDECGACECDDPEHTDDGAECVGLSSGWSLLDGGDFLCPECFDAEYEILDA